MSLGGVKTFFGEIESDQLSYVLVVVNYQNLVFFSHLNLLFYICYAIDFEDK